MRRFLVLAVIGIVIGKLFVSAIVSLSQTPTDRESHFNLDKTLDANMRLAPIPDERPTMPQPPTSPFVFHQGELVAQGTVPPVPHPAVAGKKDKEAAAKKAKDKEDDKKRKKKLEDDKAKAQNKPLTTVQNPQIAFQAPGPSADSSGFQGPLTPNPTATPTPMNNQGAANNGPITNIASWEEALVNRPTAALMTSFMNLYHSKQITTAQFYQVLSAMQKSPVLLARQDALTAAETQQSSQSFQILADESQTETDATTRASALQGINSYGNVNDLHYLSGALASGDLNAKLEASTLLTTVVQAYSGKGNAALTQSLFMPFVPILKAITISQVPTILQTNAKTVLNEIDALLGIASA